jgi:hypothetical protein
MHFIGALQAFGKEQILKWRASLKTALGFLTEEGRTRSKNAARRINAYAVVMFLVAGEPDTQSTSIALQAV